MKVVRIVRPGYLTFDGPADNCESEGWILDRDEIEGQFDDEMDMMRSVLASMLIHIAKEHGINLCLGDGPADSEAKVPFSVERDAMKLLDKVKK